MKIKDILHEDATDVVARFYKDANTGYDRAHNPEIDKYKDLNSKYRNEIHPEWNDNGLTRIFSKPNIKVQSMYNTTPRGNEIQSPGFRGLQHALAAAGLPYNHIVQDFRTDPARMLAIHAKDAARRPS